MHETDQDDLRDVDFAGHNSATAGGEEPIDIGSRLELFIDDHLIDKTEGDINRQLIYPEPQEVVIETGEPWEGNTSGYYSLFQDGTTYRMIYRGWQHDAEMKATHKEVTCYAESPDGIHWTKPNLGLFEWNGSKDNNIVWLSPGTHNFTAFRDDNPAATGRLGTRPSAVPVAVSCAGTSLSRMLSSKSCQGSPPRARGRPSVRLAVGDRPRAHPRVRGDVAARRGLTARTRGLTPACAGTSP